MARRHLRRLPGQRRPEGDQRMRVLKDELRQALTGPGRLPEGEPDDAVECDEKFLRRLWRDFYGGEPAPGP